MKSDCVFERKWREKKKKLTYNDKLCKYLTNAKYVIADIFSSCRRFLQSLDCYFILFIMAKRLLSGNDIAIR